MKRSYLKKCVDELYKAIDQNYDKKKYEVMELNARTCITPQGELYVRLSATVSAASPSEPSYEVSKDFDL